MSFQNGIGNLQQLFTPLDAANAASVAAANRTGQVQQGAQSVAPPVAAKADNDVDQASLSSIGGLAAQALQAPDVRQEKIAPLQAAIAAGTYNVSSAAVADKMIGSLLGRGLHSSSNG